MTEKIELKREMSQKEFNEKITYNYLMETLMAREEMRFTVISDDEDTVNKITIYRSNSGYLYIGKQTLTNILHMAKDVKKLLG